MSEPRCDGCNWWIKLDESRYQKGRNDSMGFCHGGPPSAAPHSPGLVLSALWPATLEWDSCGAFKADARPGKRDEGEGAE